VLRICIPWSVHGVQVEGTLRLRSRGRPGVLAADKERVRGADEAASSEESDDTEQRRRFIETCRIDVDGDRAALEVVQEVGFGELALGFRVVLVNGRRSGEYWAQREADLDVPVFPSGTKEI